MKKIGPLLLSILIISGCALNASSRERLSVAAGKLLTHEAIYDRTGMPNDSANSIAISDDANPKDVVFLFLVDESRSTIGAKEAKHCSYSNPIHKQNLEVLFKILWDLPEDRVANIHIGVYRFGEKDSPVIPLSPFSKIEKEKLEDYLGNTPNDGTTSYALAITNAAKDLSKYNVSPDAQKFLFILTDSFDLLDEKDGIENAFLRADPSTEIYVSLACPDELRNISKSDYEYWGKHRIPQANFPIPFFQTVFENLNFGDWGDSRGLINDNQDVFTIAGDTRRYQVFYYPFPGDSETKIHFQNKPPYTKGSSDVPMGHVKPFPDCHTKEFTLLGEKKMGFWRLESDSLQLNKPDILIDDDLINFAPLHIGVQLSPSATEDLPLGDFYSWAGCYEVGFEYSYESAGFDQPGLTYYSTMLPKPCENAVGFLCPDAQDKLSQFWDWTLNGDLSRDKLYIRPYVRISDGRLLYGEQKTIAIKYKPVLSETKLPVSLPKPNGKAIAEFYIRTIYNNNSPKIFLVRSKEFRPIPGVPCPQPSSQDEDWSYLQINVNDDSQLSPRAFKYRLHIPEYHYREDGCGFSTLIVEWEKKGDNQLASQWECSYTIAESAWKCKEMEQ